MRPARIDVEIEELVLHGFGGVDGAAVADALAARLQETLRRDPRGLIPRDADHLVSGVRFDARDLRAASLGARVADGIHEAVRGRKRMPNA